MLEGHLQMGPWLSQELTGETITAIVGHIYSNDASNLSKVNKNINANQYLQRYEENVSLLLHELGKKQDTIPAKQCVPTEVIEQPIHTEGQKINKAKICDERKPLIYGIGTALVLLAVVAVLYFIYFKSIATLILAVLSVPVGLITYYCIKPDQKYKTLI